MVIDMRGVTLTLTNPTSISYWDVETNLTIVGLTLWTNQELWTQGMVTAAVDNADGSVQVTVQTDSGYDNSIWCANLADEADLYSSNPPAAAGMLMICRDRSNAQPTFKLCRAVQPLS